MKPYLMTRGRARILDYNFLGAAPAHAWWDILKQHDLVVLEKPEVIVSGGETLNVLISGLPSRRRDVHHTEIRFTIVVNDLQEDTELAGSLAATGLSPGGRVRLGTLLDELFDDEKVDALLNGSAEEDDVEELLTGLLSSADWPTEVNPSGSELEGSWTGPADDEGVQQAFLARITRLAAGESGFAFTSHCLTTPDGAARAAAALPGISAILLFSTQLQAIQPLNPLEVQPPAGPGMSVFDRVSNEMLRILRFRWKSER